MTFEARELSAESGKPVLLAAFFLSGVAWRFARADQDVIHDGNTYAASTIGQSRIRQARDFSKNEVRLTVPRDNPVAELWRVSPPTGTVATILKEIHADETDDMPAFLGHVGNVSWDGQGSAELSLQPGIVAMRATGLRRKWQRGCPHVLYGPACRVDREDHRVPMTVTAISGNTLTAAGFGALDRYAGGYIEWVDSNGITDWRFILEQAGTTVTLLTTAPLLEIGDSFDAFRGCAHNLAACDEFDNVPNYGGIPYFLRKNPFGPDPIY